MWLISVTKAVSVFVGMGGAFFLRPLENRLLPSSLHNLPHALLGDAEYLG